MALCLWQRHLVCRKKEDISWPITVGVSWTVRPEDIFMKKINFLTQAAMIAALYVVLTLAINAFGLASGAIQVRVSEALTILPYFTPAAIPGLFIGCLLSNTITGCALFDIIFGSIATLLGAVGTYLLRRHKWLAPVSPIIANTIIVPFVLSYVYGTPGTIPYLMLTVGIGEVLSCGVLGMVLLFALNKYRTTLFGVQN